MNETRRVIHTEAYIARLEEILSWYAENGALPFCNELTRRFFEDVEPRLLRFPASGAPLRDVARVRSLSRALLCELDLPETDLELREVILCRHVVLYGFDDRRLVFLYLRHDSQQGY